MVFKYVDFDDMNHTLASIQLTTATAENKEKYPGALAKQLPLIPAGTER